MNRELVIAVEKSLLRGKWQVPVYPQNNIALDLANTVIECRFREALTSQAAGVVFQVSTKEFGQPLGTIMDLTGSPADDEVETEIVRLALAVACLHAFVQANWLGPDLDVQPLEAFTGHPGASSSLTDGVLNSKAISELAYGGEPAYHLSKAPAFLRLAQLLLDLPYNHLESVPWWKLRTSLTHLHILDEPVAPPDDFHASINSITSNLTTEPDLAGRMYLELGLLDHLLSQDKIAADYFVKAARATGLQYELTGALGKRTKFQQVELSQLVLLAESRLSEDLATEGSTSARNKTSDAQTGAPVTDTQNVPEALALNDDTLLEQTEFTSSQPAGLNSTLSHINPSAQPPLHPLDQSILLSLCLNVRNTSPSHGLTTEQMSPYVSRVISHPRNWSVHTMALLLRSRLESSRTRTVERSTLQLQALIQQMPTSDSTISERLLYYHSIPLPSQWEMEKELADRFLGLGVVKSALEIFERLEMWEDVVKCYAALEKREKGITVVRDLLEGRKAEAEAVMSRGKASSDRRREVEDTTREAKLWCLLGDLEPEKAADHYAHAWKVSNQTSGRAMRSLGGFHFARANYTEAIVCLKRAVKINPLLSRSWFILGCACMRLEDWEGAKDAFGRCVTIDEEDGESWNNLASMYLRMGISEKKKPGLDNSKSQVKEDDANLSFSIEGQGDAIPFESKMLAFRALKQGLRYSYENWRMWSNYMVVSMDVGELQEACRALTRIIEQTSEKAGILCLDEDVVERLVDAVTRAPFQIDETVDDVSVMNPNEGHGLFKNVSLLFEKTILPRMSTPRIFRVYGRLLSWQGKWEQAIQAYLNWYRSSNAGSIQKGETDATKWREAVTEVEDAVDILRNFGPRVEGYKWRLQGRSLLRTFIGRTKDFEEEPEWHRLLELQEELRSDDE